MTAQSTTTTTTTTRTTPAQHGGERQSPAPAKQGRAQSEAPRWNDSVQPVADLIRAVVTVCDGVVDTDTLTIGTRVQHSYYCQIYYDLHGVQFRFPKRAHTKTLYRTVLRSELVAMLNAARESARPQPPAPAVATPAPDPVNWAAFKRAHCRRPARWLAGARVSRAVCDRWQVREWQAALRFDPQTGGYDEPMGMQVVRDVPF